jgi:outer membrane protein OmpA-like peptidoglycan-associated protein
VRRILLLLLFALPAAAAAQVDTSTVVSPTFGETDASQPELEPPPEPRFEGMRVDGGVIELGTVNLAKGDAGFLLGGHLGLGTLFAPWLDFSGGVRFWSANIDRSDFGDTAEGRLKNFSVHPDLRAHLFRWKGVRPYVVTGLTAQFVSADIPGDESLEDALAGFRVGYDAGFGVSSTNRNVKLRVEVRREFAEDIGNWTFTAGFGTWPIVVARREERAAGPVSRTPVIEQFAPVLEPGDVPEARFGAESSREARSDTESDATIRSLREENRRLRADRDALRRELDEERARHASSPEAPPIPSSLSPAPLSATSWIISGGSVFRPAGAELTDAGRDEVRRIADELLGRPEVRVAVEGHTDSGGDALRNLTLSEERAAAVRIELIRLWIDASRVRASGFGSTMPLSEEAMEGGLHSDDRVEIRVLNR